MLTKEWSNKTKAQNNFYDGYYCAIRFDIKTGFLVGGDILGLFPVYYFSDGVITLAASSPELFQHHERFKPELCMEGLTGMLLTMHSVEGLTLWKNVRRLQAGYLLADTSKGSPREIVQYKIPLSEKYYGIPFKRQIELLHEKMGQAVLRHAPANQAYSLLFSGGLDSRMLAGYLQERGKDITAITLGKPNDTEMKIAKKVMKALLFKHISFERSLDDYLHYAYLSARWEHGLLGFNSIHSWGTNRILESQDACKVISGLHHDGIISGLYANYLRENDSSEEVFSKIFSLFNKWAVPVDDIEELFVRPSDKATVQTVVDKLKKKFYSYSDSDYQKVWCFNIFHRGRYHHGGAIWKMSFGAWPVIPIIDSAVLEVLAGLPCASKSGRRAQRELVCTYFSDLAKIALDANNNNPEPLIPTWQFLLWQKIKEPKFINRSINAVKRRLTGSWHNNLYYHRIYDINNKGWKSIRRKAEQGRCLTSPLFDQEKLQELLPDPEHSPNKKLANASGLKTLLGFLMWLQSH